MKNKILTALAAGMAAALFLATLQHFFVTPLILQAETFEVSEPDSESTAADFVAPVHDHDHHAHASPGWLSDWAPEDGWQRTLSTASADLVSACGFALILVALFSLRPPASALQGLYWGAAGFGVFFLAPGLGLPPELPGTEAAVLEARQTWWLLTVLATAGGLACLVLLRPVTAKGIGLLLLVMPHIVGAPQPLEPIALAPAALQAAFEWTTGAVNAVFWLALGWLCAALYRRWCATPTNAMIGEALS